MITNKSRYDYLTTTAAHIRDLDSRQMDTTTGGQSLQLAVGIGIMVSYGLSLARPSDALAAASPAGSEAAASASPNMIGD
jgi:hypothetical protein